METMATLDSGEDFIDDLHFFPPFALGGKFKLVKPCSCYEKVSRKASIRD